MNNQEQQTFGAAIAARHVAIGTAWVAGVFSAIVCALLILDYLRRPAASDPAEVEAYRALKRQAMSDPRNEELKEHIRSVDLELRRAYFGQREFARRGARLLLAGLVLTVGSLVLATEMKRRIPCPQPRTCKHDRDEAVAATGRLGVALLASLSLGLMIGVSLYSFSELALLEASWVTDLPEPELSTVVLARSGAATDPGDPVADTTPAVFVLPPPPPRDEVEKHWPTFRGPDGSGISRYTNIPVKWNGETGEGILWKTAVPLPGNNSPIVWADRVFVSGADQDTRAIYCFDADTGRPLWTRELPRPADAAPPKTSEYTGYAAPTMATDGRLAYAIFADCDVFACDYDGNVIWSHAFGHPDSAYGYAASLAVFEDNLIVQLDLGGRRDRLSKIVALDAATGQVQWETPRDSDNSWSSPIVVDIAGTPQVVAAGCPYVFGYDARTGAELWFAEATYGDMGPSPVARGNMIYTATEYLQLSAIDATGSGDVTQTHIRWTGDRGLPDTSSPLVTEKYVLVLESSGYVTCYAIETGDMLWELRTEAHSSYSSMGMAGDLIYLFGHDGVATLFQATDEEGRIVAECPLGEECSTSPAFQNGRIYIRGAESLFCIGG